MTKQNSELDELSADELREQLIALQEENKTLTDLFHTIVYDLRAPLAMIAGAAHLLLDGDQDHFSPLDENQTVMVEIVKNHANRVDEVYHELMKLVEKANTLENLGSSLVQDYRRQLFEANRKLDKLNLKHEAMQYALQSAANDFLSSVSFILGFSQLLLEHPESMGGPLNSEQIEGIEAIDRHAKKIHEAIRYYFFDSFRAIELIDAEPVPEAVTLAEIGEMTRFSIESEFALDTAVFINKREAEAIINLLAAAWYRRIKGSVLEVTAVAEDYLRFRFPHTTQIPSSHVNNYVDSETGKLCFPERQRYLDLVGLATGLVEKYGGAVYAELTGERTCHLSFTLPVYREES